jgi:hypothetical protein
MNGRFIETLLTRMHVVRCRRHKYAFILACCLIINNETFLAPLTSPKNTVVKNITLQEPIKENKSTTQYILFEK